LQGGIHLDDACPEFLREGAEVFVVVFHAELLVEVAKKEASFSAGLAGFVG
jgi:hypothetical protein